MAKKDYEEMSKQILEFVGGKENISHFMHCVTRLRFTVKDKGLIKKDEIEKVQGVIGSKWLGEQYQIIIVTGREDTEICRQETLKWLSRYLSFDDFLFFMRKNKDYRKDSVVKMEIYNENIKDKYCVAAVFDDRDQVVNDCWRKLGLLCNQVWKGDF